MFNNSSFHDTILVYFSLENSRRVSMAVCYNKLFKLMIDQKISNAELRKRAGISANIISKLKHDRYISLDSIEKICGVMGCSVDQMLEFVPEQDEVKE